MVEREEHVEAVEALKPWDKQGGRVVKHGLASAPHPSGRPAQQRVKIDAAHLVEHGFFRESLSEALAGCAAHREAFFLIGDERS